MLAAFVTRLVPRAKSEVGVRCALCEHAVLQ